MNKMIMIAIAGGVVTALLLKRKERRPLKPVAAPMHPGNAGKHITTVFARAKQHGL